MRSLSLPARGARALFAGIAFVLAAVQFLPLYTGGYEHEVAFLATHVGATTAIALLAIGVLGRREPGDGVPLLDVVLVLLALVCAGYFVAQGARIAERIEGVDDVFALDYVFGLLLIAILLEACRRVAGMVLTTVAVVFIVYVFVGPYLPEAIAHRGLSLKRFVDLQVLSTSAIFGTPISASAHMVFYFVIVGAFLERSGAGKLFVDIAYGLTARSWGGAGKAAVVASGLIGTVSGSAVANVLLSGLMTIPLMKRSGFTARFAGAIEATASTGGQLAPPIMGAAAFVLADIVGVSYAEVVYAAVVPALLYYTALFMLVHFYSLRNGLKPDHGLPIAEHLAGLKERWHLLLPLVVMIYLLISQFSLLTVGAYTTLLIVAISMVRKATRMNLKSIFEALLNGARAAAEVAVPSAIAGIIVGTLVQTGMALKLQRWLLDLAGNSLAISLAGAMVLTIILGMGMPTTAAYLVSAILVAPALQELGVPALAAHLFILYFGILSMVTPPVALSAYAAAGISGANLWNTGVTAFLLAVPGFLIPYAFAINPALLLQSGLGEAALVIVSALAGVIGLSAASGGYAFGPLAMPLRIAMFCLSPLLIAPDLTTDFVGAGGLAAVSAYQLWRYKFGPARTRSEAAGGE
ncbi:MAG: TRAP transporter permease [Methyloligellaceae bacterium]